MRKPETRNPQSGFTLIELVVVVSIVAILMGMLLDRVWYYQELAEKTAMVEVEGVIQSALAMQQARLVTHGEVSGVTAFATDNPMNWLARKPRNYSGEYYDPTPRAIAPGNWMFDLKQRELIYVLNRADHFTPGRDGNKWIRYRVNLQYESAPAAPGKTAAKELVGILFEPTEPYRWLD